MKGRKFDDILHLIAFLFFLPSLVSSVSLDVEQLCAEGESFWCQSLETAEICGAVEYCTETVWKSLDLEQEIEADFQPKGFCKNANISDKCDFCICLIKAVKWAIPRLKYLVIPVVQNIFCEYRRDQDKSTCRTVVDATIGYIFNNLKYNQMKICHEIKQCIKNDSSSNLSPSEILTQIIRSVEYQACEATRMSIRKLLFADNEETLEDNYLSALGDFCASYPSMSSACYDIGKLGLHLLLQSAASGNVCGSWLQQSQPLNVHRYNDSERCTVCVTSVKAMRSVLKAEEIHSMAQKSCDAIQDPTWRNMCQKAVLTGAVDRLIVGLNPNSFCQSIKMCKGSASEVVTMTTMSLETVISHLWPSFRCLYGPEFSCANPENAQLCQMTKFCGFPSK